MRLNDWIETLEAQPMTLPVYFDDGEPVGSLESWRGVYAHLTLTTGRAPRTVAELLAEARAAVGSTYQGYKGGDFTMDESTPVWADPYGDANNRVPVRLVEQFTSENCETLVDGDGVQWSNTGPDRVVIETYTIPFEYQCPGLLS